MAGTTTSFTWDVNRAIPTVLDDGSQYIYGAGLVSHITSSGTFYYLADGLGSTMAMVDSAGTQSTEYQFAGEETDPSGLQYLRARYYDAGSGRFLSRDPLHNHGYVYGGNNPASGSDPSGLDTRCPTSASVDGTMERMPTPKKRPRAAAAPSTTPYMQPL